MGAWIDRPIRVELSGSTFKTVRAQSVARLMPGDTMVVELPVIPTSNSEEFEDAKLELVVDSHSWSIPVVTEGSNLVHDFTKWSTEDVDLHSAPAWFTRAKFGIFIHWGLYSVPAWADKAAGKYAEWYWYWLNAPKEHGRGTYDHHLTTYGADFEYDDFIPIFQGEKFDAKAWLELFTEAGAKYFVFTTKHHDGYALFDTEDTSHRNSVVMGPKRDFTKELLDTAEREYPHLKRGTYYSMPEWYNPLYKKYARPEDPLPFLGGPAHNPYTGKEEPYTGHIDVGDYVSDLQVPQLQILVEKYTPDLLWGDIGMAVSSILHHKLMSE